MFFDFNLSHKLRKGCLKKVDCIDQVNNKNYINEPQDPKDVILAVQNALRLI